MQFSGAEDESEIWQREVWREVVQGAEEAGCRLDLEVVVSGGVSPVHVAELFADGSWAYDSYAKMDSAATHGRELIGALWFCPTSCCRPVKYLRQTRYR